MVNESAIALTKLQNFTNLLFCLISWVGSMWVLYSKHYHLSGNKIPLWHRLPLLLTSFGFIWVVFTCLAGIFSDSLSPFSYYYVGIIGELFINAGIALIFISFIAKSIVKSKEKKEEPPVVKKVVRRRAGT